MCEDKKTEKVTVWMSERLLTDLTRLALKEDRKISDLITVVLEHHAYGHLRKAPELGEAAERVD